jgi:uncharacterized coiled-coil protein SlyX
MKDRVDWTLNQFDINISVFMQAYVDQLSTIFSETQAKLERHKQETSRVHILEEKIAHMAHDIEELNATIMKKDLEIERLKIEMRRMAVSPTSSLNNQYSPARSVSPTFSPIDMSTPIKSFTPTSLSPASSLSSPSASPASTPTHTPLRISAVQRLRSNTVAAEPTSWEEEDSKKSKSMAGLPSVHFEKSTVDKGSSLPSRVRSNSASDKRDGLSKAIQFWNELGKK